ncbi:MAG: hypothetical protein IPK66_04670 [Rhodospirillales bacterium]|nr:hypothetical protein [Rhodospirillales bacterium]
MRYSRHLVGIGVALCLGAVAACGGREAYVYKAKEFDRNDTNFNKEPTDRSAVTICYNGIGTSDGKAKALAQQECEKFGKMAIATGETFGVCPLLTPVEAGFACRAP